MEIVEIAYQAEIKAAKPGAKDWDVWAETQSALLRNGSEIPVHYNWLSGRNVKRTLTRLSMRILERDDLMINVSEASWIGYRTHGVHTVSTAEADSVDR